MTISQKRSPKSNFENKIRSDIIRINCVKYDIFYIVYILEMESWNYSSENSAGLFVNSFRFRVRSFLKIPKGKSASVVTLVNQIDVSCDCLEFKMHLNSKGL